MADRTHDAEEKLTRDVTTPDREDRTAEGEGRGLGRREESRAPDEFLSSEVNEKTARPMHPDKTRG